MTAVLNDMPWSQYLLKGVFWCTVITFLCHFWHWFGHLTWCHTVSWRWWCHNGEAVGGSRGFVSYTTAALRESFTSGQHTVCCEDTEKSQKGHRSEWDNAVVRWESLWCWNGGPKMQKLYLFTAMNVWKRLIRQRWSWFNYKN